MKGPGPRTSLILYSVCILLILSTGNSPGQDAEHYSEFRNEFFALTIDYKLDEALALCDSPKGTDHELTAAKSIIYSLMGNRDEDKDLIKKGFDILKPYQSLKGDYNIHAALAISYGMQANHSGLKEKIEFADLSVSHCKEALKLDPRLPHPNFILGRFYFELAGMGSATAKIAGAIIDKEEIDRASYDLAVSYLKVASELAPSRFLYNYYTGAAYKKLENEEEAMHYFHLADKNTRHTEDDHKADKDLQKELK